MLVELGMPKGKEPTTLIIVAAELPCRPKIRTIGGIARRALVVLVTNVLGP